MNKNKLMKILSELVIFLLFFVTINSMYGASKNRKPYISYLYPAGGQAGTNVELIIGGQFINQTTNVIFDTPGIIVESVKVIPKTRNLNGYDRKALTNRLITVLGGEVPDRRKIPRYDKQGVAVDLSVPKEFLSENLNGYSQFYIKYLMREVTLRKSPSQALDTRLKVKLKIAKNVPVGKYYLQLTNVDLSKNAKKNWGKLKKNLRSNKILFIVGKNKEINELEYSHFLNKKSLKLEKKVVNVPKNSVINGRIIDGEVDQYKFFAKQGKKVVINVVARELMPFIGDGVPGWFQAVIGVKDAITQKEIAFADDFQNNPDPTLIFTAPSDGEYILYIRDAIYRGREDFVYRMKVGKFMVIDNIYPRGGQKTDSKQQILINGIFVPEKNKIIDNTKLKNGINYLKFNGENIKYHVSKYPSVDANNSNLSMENAFQVDFPVAINGRLTSKNNIHYYKFIGKKGQKICLEVFAKRLGAPLDSVVRLYDSDGKLLKVNDDFKRSNIGLNTHHADSYLNFTLPRDGVYYFDIMDIAKAGGAAYSYRLELKPYKYDFDAVINSFNGSTFTDYNIPVTINFSNYFSDIENKYYEVRVKNYNIPLTANIIPVGVKERTFTMRIPQNLAKKRLNLKFEVMLRNKKGEDLALKDVIVGQKMMQAFIYYHWLPIGDFSLNILPKRRYFPNLKWQNNVVDFSSSNQAEVLLKSMGNRNFTKNLILSIQSGPKGILLKNSKIEKNGDVKIILEANKDFNRREKYHKTLIIMASRKITYYRKNAKNKKQKNINTAENKTVEIIKKKVTKVVPVCVLEALIVK